MMMEIPIRAKSLHIVNEASNDAPRSEVEQVIQICFSYIFPEAVIKLQSNKD